MLASIEPEPPWTVTPAAMVKVLPAPLSLMSPASFELIATVPVPPSVWVPPKARALLPMRLTLPPCSVRPSPATLICAAVFPVTFSVPARVTSCSVPVLFKTCRVSVTVPPWMVPPLSVQIPVLLSSVSPVRFSVPITATVPVLSGVRCNVPRVAKGERAAQVEGAAVGQG